MLREYVKAGEELIGFEMVIDNLHEDGQALPATLVSLMRAVGRSLGLDAERDDCLSEMGDRMDR